MDYIRLLRSAVETARLAQGQALAVAKFRVLLAGVTSTRPTPGPAAYPALVYTCGKRVDFEGAQAQPPKRLRRAPWGVPVVRKGPHARCIGR